MFKLRIRRQKWISLLLVVTFLIGCFGFGGSYPTVSYAEGNDTVFTADRAEVAAGESVAMSVYAPTQTDANFEITAGEKVSTSGTTDELQAEGGEEVAYTAEGDIAGISPQTVTFAEDNWTIKEVVAKSPLRQRVEAAIEGAARLASQKHYSMDWIAIGLARTGHQDLIPDDYLAGVVEYLEEHNGEFKMPTEYERMTLGILAAGGDPTNIGGYNLIEKIYNADLEWQGINAIIFGLIALDAKDYEIPADARWDRDKLVQAILDNECSNGTTEYGKKAGWAFGTKKKADPDMTGMAMTALAPYNTAEYPKVQQAIQRAVDWLKYVQDDDGVYSSWGAKNSESCAQVIMGLCTNNIDPAGPDFTKNGKNVVDALLSFEVENHKGFAHMAEDDGTLRFNGMANEQALYALAQYIYYLDGKGSIYHWTKEDLVPDITVKGLTNGQIVEKAELTFTATSTEELTVKVNGIEINAADGQYTAKLNAGKNKIVITAADKTFEYTVFYLIKQFAFERIGEESFHLGKEAHLKVKSTNLTDTDQEVSLIIGLYDQLVNKLVNYSYVNKIIKARETEEIAGGFLVPEAGNYVVKGFVWDNMDDMNVLGMPIIVEVE